MRGVLARDEIARVEREAPGFLARRRRRGVHHISQVDRAVAGLGVDGDRARPGAIAAVARPLPRGLHAEARYDVIPPGKSYNDIILARVGQ